MTTQGIQFPRFYVTVPGECPYLEGQEERKVFTDLSGPEASALNEALGRVGFRRSQDIAYRPACEGCAACISVRIVAPEFAPGRNHRRIIKRNSDLEGTVKPLIATEEQYALLSSYLDDRHAGGSMSQMSMDDYREMVEKSPVATLLIEYRQRLSGDLVGVALTDLLSDGLSMVYSFFDTSDSKRSLGTWMILDHVERACKMSSTHVYLGYWVKGSQKMDYKARFSPLECLGPEGWSPMVESD